VRTKYIEEFLTATKTVTSAHREREHTIPKVKWCLCFSTARKTLLHGNKWTWDQL